MEQIRGEQANAALRTGRAAPCADRLRPMKAAIFTRMREIERLPQRLLVQVFDFEKEVEDA